MPAGYENMRDKFMQEFMAKGMKKAMALKQAKTKAAKMWNAQHPDNPVGPSEMPTKSMRKAMGL